MLQRVLETEVVEDRNEAVEYDSMDHADVNRNFVTDLLLNQPLGDDILDLGTGTALIPIELCRRTENVRVMASDFSVEMLELARYRLEIEGFTHRIQLQHGDAKHMIFQSNYFDTVMSNSLVHHLPSHDTLLPEVLRVLRPGGLIFIRDLCRPKDQDELESLVHLYAGHESECARQMFRQSLHAALTLDEVGKLLTDVGLDPECVQMTSDRHWTLIARKK